MARQQHEGLGRIVAELAKTGHKRFLFSSLSWHLFINCSSEMDGSTLISARDSVLSQLLGPLITTNSKTWFLTCVSPYKDDFAETIHSLQFVKRFILY